LDLSNERLVLNFAFKCRVNLRRYTALQTNICWLVDTAYAAITKAGLYSSPIA
jgi:hypothetical protein